MRTSSALQPELPGLSAGTASTPQQPDFLASAPRSQREATVTGFSPLSRPDPSVYPSAYAITSRLLARLNTTVVKREEVDGLFRERQELLDKKFAGTMTREEQNRLDYVRWSLDRIEDAKSGAALDALESVVTTYERFASDMKNFESQLQNAVDANRKRPR